MVTQIVCSGWDAIWFFLVGILMGEEKICGYENDFVLY